MRELAFDFDWEEPLGAKGPELRATWARLEVAVAGEVVTRVFDKRTRSVRTSLYLPLYPVAEWIASNWWRLLFETSSHQHSDRNGYASRHCLARAGEGFVLPTLFFEPLGEVFSLSWKATRRRCAPVEFVGDGNAWLKRESVCEELTRFLEAVVGRLDAEGVQETPLQEEWEAIRELETEEQEFCRLSAALGFDPFEVSGDQEARLIAAAERVPKEIRDEFFSSADPASLLEESEALQETLSAVSRPHRGLQSLRNLRESFSRRMDGQPAWTAVHGAPWHQGYQAARALRAELELDGDPLPSFESIGKALGLDPPVLEETVLSAQRLLTVDGVLALDDEGLPTFAIKPAMPPARRFAFCRELVEYLFAARAATALVTRSTTYRQQRNRAFAAEFLLPSDVLRARVHTDAVSYREGNKLVDEFGVSWAVVAHQLKNHGIAEIIPS